jgi:hypothetical protein
VATGVAPAEDFELTIAPNGKDGFAIAVVELKFGLAATFMNTAREAVAIHQADGNLGLSEADRGAHGQVGRGR